MISINKSCSALSDLQLFFKDHPQTLTGLKDLKFWKQEIETENWMQIQLQNRID